MTVTQADATRCLSLYYRILDDPEESDQKKCTAAHGIFGLGKMGFVAEEKLVELATSLLLRNVPLASVRVKAAYFLSEMESGSLQGYKDDRVVVSKGWRGKDKVIALYLDRRVKVARGTSGEVIKIWGDTISPTKTKRKELICKVHYDGGNTLVIERAMIGIRALRLVQGGQSVRGLSKCPEPVLGFFVNKAYEGDLLQRADEVGYDFQRELDGLLDLFYGLEAIQRKGMVYTDIQPVNVVYDKNDRFFFIDFDRCPIVALKKEDLANSELMNDLLHAFTENTVVAPFPKSYIPGGELIAAYSHLWKGFKDADPLPEFAAFYKKIKQVQVFLFALLIYEQLAQTFIEAIQRSGKNFVSIDLTIIKESESFKRIPFISEEISTALLELFLGMLDPIPDNRWTLAKAKEKFLFIKDLVDRNVAQAKEPIAKIATFIG